MHARKEAASLQVSRPDCARECPLSAIQPRSLTVHCTHPTHRRYRPGCCGTPSRNDAGLPLSVTSKQSRVAGSRATLDTSGVERPPIHRRPDTFASFRNERPGRVSIQPDARRARMRSRCVILDGSAAVRGDLIEIVDRANQAPTVRWGSRVGTCLSQPSRTSRAAAAGQKSAGIYFSDSMKENFSRNRPASIGCQFYRSQIILGQYAMMLPGRL